MNYNNVSFEAAFGDPKQFFESNIPEFCFAGRSNVGKSSLINKVLGRKSFARVSTKPGKTITINFYKLDGIRLVDLPGYGYAKKQKSEIKRWGDMIEAYFSTGRNIAFVFQLIDFRRKASPEDIQMLEYLTQQKIPFAIVFTKCDKLNKTQTIQRMEQISEELERFDAPAFLFSALTGQGVEEVKNKIMQLTEGA